MNIALIQMAKSPIAGKVKTRMLPNLSQDEACELHCELVRRVAVLVNSYGNFSTELWVTKRHPFFDGLSRYFGMKVFEQNGNDLGERMAHASRTALIRADAVILVGSDCPFFSRAYFTKVEKFLKLKTYDVVIGPADDGGYVLLAFKNYYPDLFEGIAWGTSRVYRQTLQAINNLGLRYHEMEVLSDIDRPEDLAKL